MPNIFMRFPDGKKKALTLSYDDGVEQDIRLIDIMKKNGLKGTFNINSGLYAKDEEQYSEKDVHKRLTRDAALHLYKDSGMEVAVHGVTHLILEQLPSNLCVEEIFEDRKNLERDYKKIVRGMAYPHGSYNDEVVNILKQCGIAYSRTVEVTGKFDIPTDWLRLPATCHHNDKQLMELAVSFVENKVSHAPQMFYLWGHSYEFDEYDNWYVIENFAKYIGCREDIWYATNIEIYDYIAAYKQLIFSTECVWIQNPTAIKLYFEVDGQIYSVNSGETLDLR